MLYNSLRCYVFPSALAAWYPELVLASHGRDGVPRHVTRATKQVVVTVVPGLAARLFVATLTQ